MAVIICENVWKTFRQRAKPRLFREQLAFWFRKNPASEFSALKGVSFQVKHAEGLAVIGSNGAGKSTELPDVLYQFDSEYIGSVSGQLEHPIDFPDPPQHDTYAYGINDSGMIAGHYLRGNQVHGFLLTGGTKGTFTNFDLPSSYNTFISAINNLGDFAGYNGKSGFVNIGGVTTVFDFPGAHRTVVSGIAWDGTVVGGYKTPRPHPKDFAFVRGPNGKLIRFEVENSATSAAGINNEAGSIVGGYNDPADGRTHDYVYSYLTGLKAHLSEPGVQNEVSNVTVLKTAVQTIDYPGAVHTSLIGINAKGEIVGAAYFSTSTVYFIGTPLP